jgi:hypothetical protein
METSAKQDFRGTKPAFVLREAWYRHALHDHHPYPRQNHRGCEGGSTMEFSGGCSCRAVRYTIQAEPVRSFQCQCRDCQLDSGGGHSSVFVFPRAAFEISGEVREIARTSDRGATKRKGFCPVCGVSIYNKPENNPDLIGIYVGSLDDATSFKPAAVFYTSRGHGWDFLDPDVPKLQEWRPSSN